MTLISGIYMALALATLVVYVVNYKADEPYQKFVVIYLVAFLCAGIAAIGAIEFKPDQNNLFVFHIFNPVEYVILSMLYISAFQNVKVKSVIRISMPVVVVLSIVFALFVQPLNVNNSYFIMIESVLIVVWSLLFLRETIILQKESQLQRFPMFWISVGLLFYFIGSLCVEALLNYLLDHSLELSRKAYKVSFIFKYLLFILLMMSATCRIFFKTDADHYI